MLSFYHQIAIEMYFLLGCALGWIVLEIKQSVAWTKNRNKRPEVSEIIGCKSTLRKSGRQCPFGRMTGFPDGRTRHIQIGHQVFWKLVTLWRFFFCNVTKQSKTSFFFRIWTDVRGKEFERELYWLFRILIWNGLLSCENNWNGECQPIFQISVGWKSWWRAVA